MTTASPSAALTSEPPEERPLSRRELLVGVAAGGAALAATNAANTLITRRLTADASEASWQARVQALEAQVRRLQVQLALYRDLDRIGFDSLVSGALDLYDRLWPGVQGGIGLLRAGVEAVQGGVDHFDALLPGLLGSVQALEAAISTVEGLVAEVEEAIGEVLKKVAPVGKAVTEFLAWLVSKIPFGVGAAALAAANRLSTMVDSTSSLAGDARSHLVQPLRQDWLSSVKGQGLRGRLLEPLRSELIAPLQEHLDKVESLASEWQQGVAGPVRAALAEREKILQKISQADRQASS